MGAVDVPPLLQERGQGVRRLAPERSRLVGATVPSRLDDTSVAVWGVSRWTSAVRWGQADPRRDPLTVDRYTGQAHWARHCWTTDPWLRW
jgi:hypothetical protein